MEFEASGRAGAHRLNNDLAELLMEVEDDQMIPVDIDGVAGLQLPRCKNHAYKDRALRVAE